MKFESSISSYATRYFAWLNAFLSICALMLLYPLALGKGFIFLELFERFFFSDIRLTGFMFAMIAMFQIVGWDISNKRTKVLKILDNKVIFYLFNGKVIELDYSYIQSLELTNDIYKNFEFTLKTGEKKVIYATIKNKQQAFDLIQQRIVESKLNNA